MTVIGDNPRPAAAPDALVQSMKTALRARHAPVAIVSGFAGAQPVGCVVSAFLSLSLQPPSLLVSLQHGSQTLECIQRSGRFGLSLLGEQHDRLIQTFSTGNARDRFRSAKYGVSCDVPLLEGSPATFACALSRVVPMYDHVLLVGDVLQADSGPRSRRTPAGGLAKVAS